MTTYRVPRSDKATDETFRSFVALIEKLQQGNALDAEELKLVKDVSCKELAEFWRLPERPQYQVCRLSFSSTLKADYCYRSMRTILQAMLRAQSTKNAIALNTAIEEGSGLTIEQFKSTGTRPSRRTNEETNRIFEKITAGLANSLSSIVSQAHVNSIMANVKLRDNPRAWRFVYADTSKEMQLYINTLAPMPRLQVDSYRITDDTLNADRNVQYVFMDDLYFAPIHCWIGQLAIYQLLDGLNRNRRGGEIQFNKAIQAVMDEIKKEGVKPLMKRIIEMQGWDQYIVHASRTQINQLLDNQRRTKRSRTTNER